MIEPDKCERRKEVDAQERSYKVNDIGNMRLMLGMRMGIFKTRKATIGERRALNNSHGEESQPYQKRTKPESMEISVDIKRQRTVPRSP